MVGKDLIQGCLINTTLNTPNPILILPHSRTSKQVIAGSNPIEAVLASNVAFSFLQYHFSSCFSNNAKYVILTILILQISVFLITDVQH